MTHENADINFGFADLLSTRDVRQILDTCFEVGCTTHENENQKVCWYLGPATDYESVELDVLEVVAFSL